MLIPNKFNGYARDGGRVYNADPQQSEVVQTTLPSYIQPNVERMVGQAEALANRPYQAYGYDRIAGFDPLQLQAQQGAANLGPAKQLGLASQLAGMAGMSAMDKSRYNAGNYANQYRGMDPYQGMQFGNQFAAPGAYQAGQFNAQQVNAGQYDPNAVAGMMSPYMQQVVDIQKREAAKTAGTADLQRQAAAIGSGGFGGSRAALLDAEAARNTQMQLGDIQATGSQAAFQQAQQQYNAEQARQMQAQLANQQAGMSAQQMAEQSRQFGAGQGMTAAQLQAQYGLAGLQAQEQSKQFGYGQGMQGRQLEAQYGLAGQTLGEQSRQFGANLGMQGVAQQIAAAGQLGNLGAAQFGQQLSALNLQNQFGGQRQALEQQKASQDYQDWINQQGYQQKQLSWLSDMYRGLPLTAYTKDLYTAPPSTTSALVGGATALYGATKKDGGSIKDTNNPPGLAQLALYNVMGDR